MLKNRPKSIKVRMQNLRFNSEYRINPIKSKLKDQLLKNPILKGKTKKNKKK